MVHTAGRGCGKVFKALGKHLSKNDKCRVRYWTDTKENTAKKEKALANESIHYHNRMRTFIFKMVAELYFLRYLGEALMNVLRGFIRAMVAFAISESTPEN